MEAGNSGRRIFVQAIFQTGRRPRYPIYLDWTLKALFEKADYENSPNSPPYSLLTVDTLTYKKSTHGERRLQDLEGIDDLKILNFGIETVSGLD